MFLVELHLGTPEFTFFLVGFIDSFVKRAQILDDLRRFSGLDFLQHFDAIHFHLGSVDRLHFSLFGMSRFKLKGFFEGSIFKALSILLLRVEIVFVLVLLAYYRVVVDF